MIDGNIDVLSLEGMLVSSVSLEGDLLPIGPKGDKGDPGFSPVVTTSKSGKTTTIKFETATGNVYAYIQDGEDGQGSGDMLTDVYDKNKNGIVDDAEKVNGKTVEANVPANAKFTDTVYDDTEVRSLINAKPDFSDIPTNVSELTNDAHYVSSDGASTVSGENTELSLNGTTEGMFKELDLKGNTSQKTLSGKNLFGFVDGTYTANGMTATVENGKITLNGTATATPTHLIIPMKATFNLQANTNYKFSIYNDKTAGSTSTSGSDWFSARAGTTQTNNIFEVLFGTLNSSATINRGQSYGINHFEIRCYDGGTLNNFVITPQIELGTSQTSYEQYCGGIPSPNPDYPQDVNNVSGDNQVVVCEKNLFDKNSITLGQRLDPNGLDFPDTNCFVSDYIIVKPNSTYVRNVEPSVYQSVALYKSDKTFISRSSTTQTITTTNDTKYVRLCAYNENLDVLQFELGNQPTTYEAYTGATYSIELPSGMELNKIGTYQDYIYKENDKWYLHKETGKVVLDGSNDEDIRYIGSNNGYSQLNVAALDNWVNSITNPSDLLYCNNFKYYAYAGDSSRRNDCGVVIWSNGNPKLVFSVKDSMLTSGSEVSSFKTWLSNNNTDIYYPIATTTNTEITDTTLISQLNALYKAYTYKNKTNISQSNNDLPFILNVEAFTDTYNGRYENIINMIKKVQ